MDLRRQLTDDRQTIQNLLDNNLPVICPQNPDRGVTVVEILERIREGGNRRGGPTKDMLLLMKTIVPGEFTTTPTSSKLELVEELLGNIVENREGGNVNDEPPRGLIPE